MKKTGKNKYSFKTTEGFFTDFFWTKGGEEALIRHGFGLLPANKAIVLNPEAAFLWKKISSGISLRCYENEFNDRLGKAAASKAYRAALSVLRKHNLISNKKNSLAIEKLKSDFSRTKIRRAKYAGIFYKKNAACLRRSLTQCFDSLKSRGPVMVDEKTRNISGIIVPHSNIEISGCCAAHAYKALMAFPRSDLLVLLGPNHSRIGRFPYTAILKDFETPLGTVQTDKDFSLVLQRNCNFDIFADSIAHESEHSLELQLPFLQYLYDAYADKLKIVAILCSHSRMLAMQDNNFIAALKKTVVQCKKKVVFIATGDLMHMRQFPPYAQAHHIKSFHRSNREIIRLLEEGEPKTFLKAVSSPAFVSFCGRAPFYSLLRLIAPVKGKMLNYTWKNKRLSLQKRARNHLVINRDVGHVSMVFTSP